ncbi:MAG: hypothetical protein A3B96_02235 [Candidatus Spechtbacteria bacterium RIFCSPHIGHO2_02_FULL_43_15b]|nr:MAG: hypothetical protein A3B96_02235 [Candidatus Spechtbacteria bacterium RIFCSPHIGHO2_02_FULL_43_15b]
MNTNDLQKFKVKLENTKKNLNEALRTFANKDPLVRGDWDTRYPEFKREEDPNVDMEEEASEVEAYVTRLPIEHSYELRIQAIDKALLKIADNTYGICLKCDKPIPLKRLEAYPEADKCLDCQKKFTTENS